jgi:hypothetical protein
MSRYPHETQPTHQHPVPKGGSKTHGLPTLGSRDRCWCGKPVGHSDPHRNDR